MAFSSGSGADISIKKSEKNKRKNFLSIPYGTQSVSSIKERREADSQFFLRNPRVKASLRFKRDNPCQQYDHEKVTANEKTSTNGGAEGE
jgi:hypothetical protein